MRLRRVLPSYPDRDDLVTASRVDQHGHLETRQIYEYGLGVMASGDIMFSFVYATSVFAVYLSRPPSIEYIMGFNNCNSFAIRSRWTEFRKPNQAAQIVA
jgi:hypothetical protein